MKMTAEETLAAIQALIDAFNEIDRLWTQIDETCQTELDKEAA